MTTSLRILAALLFVGTALAAARADDFERPPISYSSTEPDNQVSRLIQRIASGDASLTREPHFGYLRSLLRELAIPESSQVLVFSKTSLQRNRISPRTPRAIYFSDNAYVGYCQSGDVLEVSAVDDRLGAVFYTLDQHATDGPLLLRQTDNCLICHSSSRTDSVPGHVVRSLLVDRTGNPLLAAGGYTVDHTTPFAQRWGGWYVTGTHGGQTHLGNHIARPGQQPQLVANPDGQNVTDLAPLLAVDKYLTPHSDLVALLILEHQALVHNRITRASFAARQALHYQAEWNRTLGEPADHELESTARRIQSAGEALVEALLLVDEAPLTAPVAGTSSFAAEFAATESATEFGTAPRDSHGRSLRDLDLDLERRMFRYPCSYLLYSPAFAALPEPMLAYVWQRLWQILTAPTSDSASTSDKFAHLSAADRQSIREIIQATHPHLPAPWPAPAQ